MVSKAVQIWPSASRLLPPSLPSSSPTTQGDSHHLPLLRAPPCLKFCRRWTRHRPGTRQARFDPASAAHWLCHLAWFTSPLWTSAPPLPNRLTPAAQGSSRWKAVWLRLLSQGVPDMKQMLSVTAPLPNRGLCAAMVC